MPKSYQLLTIPEVARQLGFRSRYPIYKIIHEGKIRTCTIRGRWRVAQSDLDAYVESVRDLAKGDKKHQTPRLMAVEITE